MWKKHTGTKEKSCMWEWSKIHKIMELQWFEMERTLKIIQRRGLRSPWDLPPKPPSRTGECLLVFQHHSLVRIPRFTFIFHWLSAFILKLLAFPELKESWQLSWGITLSHGNLDDSFASKERERESSKLETLSMLGQRGRFRRILVSISQRAAKFPSLLLWSLCHSSALWIK